MKPLLDKKFVLEKYPGKGGWTFVRIPKTFKNKEEKLLWKKVRGTIDDYEIENIIFFLCLIMKAYFYQLKQK
jgi:hypothetical protein